MVFPGMKEGLMSPVRESSTVIHWRKLERSTIHKPTKETTGLRDKLIIRIRRRLNAGLPELQIRFDIVEHTKLDLTVISGRCECL